MEKATKVKLVGDLKDKAARAAATFVAEYSAIKAVEMNEFRRNLRGASVEFKIVRNTLAKRAFAGTPAEGLSGHLKGTTALAFSFKDAVAAAKILTEFSRSQPNLKLRACALGPKVIGLREIGDLAALPPREVLIGKMLGSMKSPASGIVGVLSAVPRKLLYALNAVREKKAAG